MTVAMNTAKVAAIIVSCSIGLFSTGCASDMDSHQTGEGSADLLARESSFTVKYPAPLPPPPPPTETKDTSGDKGGQTCADTALPALVDLVNAMLASDPALGPMLVDGSDSYGARIKVAVGTPADEDNVKKVMDAYLAETGSSPYEFVPQLLDFQKMLVSTAVPAIVSSTCGTPYPYFAVPFPSLGDALKYDWFFKRSQHKYLPTQQCDQDFVAANGVPRGSYCAYVDPTWSSKGNHASLSTQRYSGTTGNAWIPSASIAVTGNPYTAVDAATGYSTVTFTAYRAAGDLGIFTTADTTAVRLTYNLADMGVWQADVTSVPTSTGSKAVFRVQRWIAP